jgi:hypothetical protein
MRWFPVIVMMGACSVENGFTTSSEPEGTEETTPLPTEVGTVPPVTTTLPEPTTPVEGSALRITPDPLELGDVWVGCDREDSFTVTNIGDTATTVTDVFLDGTAFAFGIDSLPIKLGPGASFEIPTGFVPTDDGPDAAELTVSTNDGIIEVATVAGNGQRAGMTSTTFLVEEPAVDLIFIVDQSSSMDPFQAELNRNFADFIDQLEDYTSNWQLVVANSDDGCNTTGILTPDTPDYQTIFNARVKQGAGLWIGDHPTLPDREAMLTIAANATDQSAAGRCNEGLLRDGAQLHAILVSDEKDHSDHGWGTYVSRIEAAKGDASLITISAFIDSMWGNDEGYRQAVAATGGVNAPIDAASWASFMPSLAAHSIPDAQFVLGEDADADTIEVTVNGLTAARDAWTWDPASRTVTVDSSQATLAQDDEVTVHYHQVAVCD